MTTFFTAGTSDKFAGQNAPLHVAIPTNAQAGDLAIAMVWTTGTTAVHPPGWSTNPLGGQQSYVMWRSLTSSDPGTTYTVDVDISAAAKLVWVIYRGQGLTVDGIADSEDTNTTTAPSVTTTASNDLIVHFFGTLATTATWTPPPGETLRYTAPAGYLGPDIVTDVVQSTAGPSAASTATGGGGSAKTATVAIKQPNNPPNAPTPTSPANNASVDRSQPITLAATFSDPDPGDSPSASQWRYRLTGASPWTTVEQGNTLQNYAIPAGLAAGNYEWQAAYADQPGSWGPFCTSAFFTAADPPPGPTWLDPTNGQTLTGSTYTGAISTASLDASEWTLFADNAGAIDTATVLQGPVTVTTGDLRSHTFTGLANGVPVWWSVRTKNAGLWSQPVQIRTSVAYTPPPPPLVTLTPVEVIPGVGDSALVVGITNPAPTGDQPDAAYNDVYVDDDDGKGWQRFATLLIPNTPWTYQTPRSGVDYAGRVRVVTVGATGTTAETVTDATTQPVTELYGGGY